MKRKYLKLAGHYIRRSYHQALSERDKCYLVRKARRYLDLGSTLPVQPTV
jgi:hypothetical protein